MDETNNQGYHTTGMAAIYHVVGDTSRHTGQIILRDEDVDWRRSGLQASQPGSGS